MLFDLEPSAGRATRDPRGLALPLLSLAALGGGLLWLTAAFGAVRLRYSDPYGCPVLTQATVDALWRSLTAPLLLIGVGAVGSAIAASRRYRRRADSPTSDVVTVVLLIAALIGVGASFELSPMRRDDSVLALFWFFVGPLFSAGVAGALLIARLDRRSPLTTGWAMRTAVLATLLIVVLPLVVFGLTPTDSEGLCMS